MLKTTPNKTKYGFLAAGALTALLATSAMADYSSTLLSLSPISYWQLNETNAPLADVATNLGTLGAIGNGYYSSNVIHQSWGPLADSSDFSAGFNDSAYARVVVPWQSQYATTNAFTVEFWANPNDTTSSDSTTMCPVAHVMFGDIPGSGSGRKGWLFYQNADSGWTFRIYGNSNTGYNATGSSTISVGSWYHIVGVYDGTNVTLYINGSQAATIAAPSYVPTVDDFKIPFSIGGRGYGAYGFFRYNGSISEVAFYTNALSASEILSHYTKANSSTESSTYASTVLAKNPLLFFRLNESEADLSGQPVATNLGSLGTSYNATYNSGVVPGADGPSYTGIASPNYAPLFTEALPNSFIDAGDDSVYDFVSTPFSFTLWFKTVDNDSRFSSFIGKGDSSWRGGVDANGYTRLAFAGNSDVTGATLVNDGKWHHYVGVYDATNLYLYIDGALDGQGTASSTGTGTISPLYIGSAPDYTIRIFNGELSQVAVFDKALSLSQVQNLYNAANVPPRITVQPSGSTNNDGSTFTLTTKAIGTPTLYYQWYKDGVALSGKTSATLSLTQTTTSAAGDYTVVVTNAYGAVTSSVASVIIVAGPPVIYTQPVSFTTLYASISTSFFVSTGGSQPQYFQWYFNGTALSGKTSTNLLFSSLQTSQSGDYTVVISNSYGSVTSSISTLVVVPLPTSAYATAVLADAPIAYYRLDETNGSSVATDYIGNNNGYYTNVNLEQKGYSFADTNTAGLFGQTNSSLIGGITTIDFGGATSQPFSLEAWVKGPPQNCDCGIITKGYGSGGEQFNIDNGASSHAFRFFVRNSAGSVTAVNTTVIPDNTWHHLVGVYDPDQGLLSFYVDGILFGDSTFTAAGILSTTHPVSIGCRRSGTSSVYDYQWNGFIDDVAFYKTALTAEQVWAHYSARFTSDTQPPVIAIQPVSVTNFLSIPATFLVDAQGSGTLTYQWYFNNTSIDGSNSPSLTVNTTSATAGNYYVVVTGDYGSVTSSIVTLTALPAPTSLDVSSGLVLHLPFDGNYADLTGKGHDAIIVGSVPFTTGVIGQGIQMESVTKTTYAYIKSASDLEFDASTSFTVGFWINYTSRFNDVPIIGNATGSTYQLGWVFTDEGGYMEWSLASTANASTYLRDPVSSTLPTGDGSWHYVVGIVNRTTATAYCYIDGTLAASWSIWGLETLATGNPIAIGEDPSFNYGSATFNLDDLGIWNRALSADEVAQIYSGGLNNGISFAGEPASDVTLGITTAGSQVQLTWASGTLQASPTVNGTFTNVPTATSPYLFTPTSTNLFFRVKVK